MKDLVLTRVGSDRRISKLLFTAFLLAVSFLPTIAWATVCTYAATVNENSGTNALILGATQSGLDADQCTNFDPLATNSTPQSSLKGTWTSAPNSGPPLFDNEIFYTPNPGATGTDTFTISDPADPTITLSVTITIIPAVSVTSIGPASGPAAGGTSVTITGAGFSTILGNNTVNFGATPATVTASTATSITATSPAGSAGPVDVTVTVAGNTSATSPADRFTYVAAPTVGSVSGVFGGASGPTTGGNTVTINGTNFTSATGVQFGSIAATSLVVTSASQVTVTAPAGTGVVDVRVTTPNGTSAIVVADHYTYAPAPTVSSVSPATGPTAGNVSKTVTIGGSNFTSNSTVKFGAQVSPSITVSSANLIQAQPPNAATSTVDITVITEGGTSATGASDRYTFQSGPTATLAIASTTLTQSHAASFTPVTGSGAATPLSYAVSPALPGGLTIASSTGLITGTPAGTSSATTYTVTVTDNNGQTSTATFSLAVNGAVIATQAVANTTLTQSHAATSVTPVTGSGGAGSLSYSVSPSLPAGLSMASGTGAITGTPAVTSSATTYTVTVTDINSATATATFSLAVNSAVVATQAVTSTTLTVNQPTTPFTPVTGSGGTSSLTYSVSPSLPTGLSMASGTGAITGTSTVTSAATTYTVTVTDTNSAAATATFTLTVNAAVVASQAVASTALTVNHATTSFTPVTGSGGTTPLAYSVSPTLPTGLSMASGIGAITGTPTATSSATTYTVTVTDANDNTATATFSLTVNSAAVATQSVASSVLTVNHATTAFTPVSGSGGTGSLTYSISPALPAGLSISSSSGTITGTPTAASSATTYTVTVTDINGATSTATFSLTVNGPLVATQAVPSTTLVQDQASTSFTPVTGSGGTGLLTYSVSPSLPNGLVITSSSGLIFGISTVTSATTGLPDLLYQFHC